MHAGSHDQMGYGRFVENRGIGSLDVPSRLQGLTIVRRCVIMALSLPDLHDQMNEMDRFTLSSTSQGFLVFLGQDALPVCFQGCSNGVVQDPGSRVPSSGPGGSTLPPARTRATLGLHYPALGPL
jgi:hypothetical protein